MTKSIRGVICACLLWGILASCSITQPKSISGLNQSKKQAIEMTDSKQAADNAFLALFKDYNEEGVKRYIHPDFIQHNPFVPTGRDALIGFLSAFK